MSRRQPIFNAPSVVVWLLGVLVAFHLFRVFGPEDQAEWWTFALGFLPIRYSSRVLVEDLPGGAWSAWVSPVSHAFLHGDALHLLINCAWLLAFGSALARRIGAIRFLFLFVTSAIAGALAYWLINGPVAALLVGASGAISGLVGAAFRFFFRALEVARFDPEGLAGAARRVTRAPISDCFRDAQTRTAILIWLAVNFVTAVVLPGLGSGDAIAWEAHLGGFLFGLFAFALFDAVPVPASRTADPGSGLH